MFRKRLRQSILLVLTIAFFIMALPAHLFHGRPAYTLTDLGVETEPPGSPANPPIAALNDRGEIVGTLQVEGMWCAYFWSPDRGRRLLNLPDSTFSRALGLNNQSVVTGAFVDSNGESRSFTWSCTPSGEDSLVIGLPGTAGMAIDDQGRVIGGYEERELRHAFVWSASEGMRVFQIPDGGRVVGVATTSRGDTLIAARARIRAQYTLLFLEEGGSWRDLGQDYPLAGGGGLDMNTHGEWVGSRRIGNGPSRGPWGARQAIRGNSLGEIRDLPVWDGSTSSAAGINDNGLIVGTVRWRSSLEETAIRVLSSIDSSLGTHLAQRVRQRSSTVAALWKERELIDLNDRVSPDAGWVLEEAFDINNRGQIAGAGRLDGKSRLFLLTPIEHMAKAE